MRVELALLEGDELLERSEIHIGPIRKTTTFNLFYAHYQLGEFSAEIVLDNFADRVLLKRSTLDMPLHESEDWESIELERYTLAFWCRLNA